VRRRGTSKRAKAEAAPYAVGYGKPPKASRFKPGTSGNPGGRPKGSASAKPADVVVEQMKTLVLEEAYRPIQIRDGNKLVELPVVQAVVRSLALSAAKGQPRSQRMLIDLLAAVEGERRSNRERLFEEVIDYKLHWQKEIAVARRMGLPEPTPLPHPDSLTINPFDGSVISRGPWTEEEKAYYDQTIALKRQMEEELEEELTKNGGRGGRESAGRITAIKSVIERLDSVLKFERIIVAGARAA
jgi:Family of unknown function (DUF5681)